MAFDPLYLLVMIPGLILGLYAQFRLSGAYRKYSRIATLSGLTGAQAAREILDRAGLTDVPVERVPGHLTDHYDPIKRKLCLSEEVYQGNSVASVGIAAHESGHALQHQAAYAPLKLRMAVVPITQIASQAYLPILLIGILAGIALPKMAMLLVGIFTIIALFQVITLPVEFDASRRAKDQLFRLGLVHTEEGAGVATVLNAAAMTYVAAMVTAVLHVFYWLMVARNNR
jgi:Zn-dependent membrane protease YugP